jgi:predicted phosphoribosyltransferase
MRFEDREHAGRLLAERLDSLRDAHPVVLGLSRGGMPVALEVAKRLVAPLDLVVVRKIRVPSAPELSIGAVAEGGATFLNPTALREAAIDRQRAAALAEDEVAELARRVRLYRGAGAAPRLEGRVVVVVDDFVATGTTARAAARAAGVRGAARVLLAVPVVAQGLEPELLADFDEVIALEVSPHPRDAYARLEELSDEAALACLRRARVERAIEEIEPAAVS